MGNPVLDMEKQMPAILRALKRWTKVAVSCNGQNLVLMHSPPEKTKAADIRSNPLFGIWKDRDDFADPAAAVRMLRKGRDRS